MIVKIAKPQPKQEEFLRATKKYIAEIQLGIKTDTADREGKVIESKDLGLLGQKLS